jgi:hypothetical protein
VKYLKVYNKFQKDRRLFEEVDNPKKADLVEKDVEDFFKTLEEAAKSTQGIKQQSYGNMTYQKSVESIQIGLLLLGYELPKFGVDGLFGPETANAIEKFKNDYKNEADKKNKDSGISENLRGVKSYIFEKLELVELEETDYTNLKHDGDQTKHDLVSKVLLDDIQLAANNAGVVAKIHFAQHGHPSMGNPASKSRHKKNIAVDISSIDGLSFGQNGFKEKGDKLKDELVKLGYNLNSESGHNKAVLWQTNVGGNHFNHLHVSNNTGAESHPGTSGSYSSPETIIEPIYISLMIDKLRKKGIKSTDLQRYIDIKSVVSDEFFTQLDLSNEKDINTYAQICQKFIDMNPPNLLNITGEMMASSAKKSFDKFGSYIPPELALAQLLQEGGIANPKKRSRPIRTKNPFNVGNTDSGENEYQNTVESGIDRYYDLVAKSYLRKGKTADNLIRNFVNVSGLRYASDQGYEEALVRIVPRAKNISNQILASTQVQAQKQV